MIKTHNIGYLAVIIFLMLVAPTFLIMSTDVLAQNGYFD